MTKLNQLIAPALGALMLTGVAAPAHANYYDDPRQIRQEIRQLDRQIEQASRSGQVSERNATWLTYRLQGVRDQFRKFSYRGFNNNEISTLNHSLQIVENEIQRRSSYRSQRGYRDGNRGYRNNDYRGARAERRDDRQWDRRQDRRDDRRYRRDRDD